MASHGNDSPRDLWWGRGRLSKQDAETGPQSGRCVRAALCPGGHAAARGCDKSRENDSFDPVVGVRSFFAIKLK